MLDMFHPLKWDEPNLGAQFRRSGVAISQRWTLIDPTRIGDNR